MAANDTERPGDTGYATEEKSSESLGAHPKRGFAHWLHVAPSTATFGEVVEAYHEHESPHDAFGGER